jgi:hypothetical protein
MKGVSYMGNIIIKKKYNFIVDNNDMEDVLKAFDVFRLGWLNGIIITSTKDHKWNIIVYMSLNQWMYISNILKKNFDIITEEKTTYIRREA